jgi:hypothetical protein
MIGEFAVLMRMALLALLKDWQDLTMADNQKLHLIPAPRAQMS